MDFALALLIGAFVTVGIYLLLSRALIRMLLGLVVLGNAINLTIFAAGRIAATTPPLVPPGLDAPSAPIANPLPQALILTAIVIGFAMFAYLLVLSYRAYKALDADDTDTMRVAEPDDRAEPPLSY